MKVEVHSFMAKSGVAVVELRVPLDVAAAWVPLVGRKVQVALGAVEATEKPATRASGAVKRSQEREQRALATDAYEQHRRRYEREKAERERELALPTVGESKVRVTLRGQMPDGWLLVSDFAALVCRAIPTIRNWISRGKIRPSFVRDIPVTDFTRPTVKAISACQVERHKPQRAGRKEGKEAAPVRMLVDNVGLPDAARRAKMNVNALKAGYENPSALDGLEQDRIARALAQVLEDAESRQNGKPVAMFDGEPLNADQAAWGEQT